MGRNMDNLLLNLLFSFLLFFISNWFGKRSIKFGYHQLSFDSSEEQPIFNILYRSFTPVVFILVVSVFLDKINLFYLTKNIYITTIFYFLIRFIFILIIGRLKITNWVKYILTAFISIFISYIVYKNFIEKDTSLCQRNKKLQQHCGLRLLVIYIKLLKIFQYHLWIIVGNSIM